MKSNGVSAHVGEMAGDAESLLKGQHTKFHLQHLPWALAEGGQSELETHEESLGTGVSGERTQGTATRIPVLSHPQYCRSHLSQADLSK